MVAPSAAVVRVSRTAGTVAAVAVTRDVSLALDDNTILGLVVPVDKKREEEGQGEEYDVPICSVRAFSRKLKNR